MTAVVFYRDAQGLYGFESKGHATVDENDLDGRLVCAALSSAALMAANTVTEIFKVEAEARAEDAFLRFRLKSPNAEASRVLEGLLLHVRELTREHPEHIKFEVLEADRNA